MTQRFIQAAALAATYLLAGCTATYTQNAAGDITYSGTVALPLPIGKESEK